MPIISRRREGLVEDHPLYKAILRLVEGELGPLVAAREKRAKELSRAVENAKTTKLFSQLAREAAKFMQEMAEEEELDLPQRLVTNQRRPSGPAHHRTPLRYQLPALPCGGHR